MTKPPGFVKSLSVLLFFCFSVHSWGQEKEEKDVEFELTPLSIIAFEALFAANSWLAAENPNAFGGAAALLFPIAGCNVKFCVDLLAAESLALYNLSLDDEKETKSDIFKKNMIAWHIFAGVVGLTASLTKDENTTLSLRPLPKNGWKFEVRIDF